MLLYDNQYKDAREKITAYTGNTYLSINKLLRAAPNYGTEAFNNCNFGIYEAERQDIAILNETLRQFRLKENIIHTGLLHGEPYARCAENFPEKELYSGIKRS